MQKYSSLICAIYRFSAMRDMLRQNSWSALLAADEANRYAPIANAEECHLCSPLVIFSAWHRREARWVHAKEWEERHALTLNSLQLGQ
jgi:hypothetical protein